MKFWKELLWGSGGKAPYHPWLVAEVVNGLQGVDAGEPCVLHANDKVAEVLILCHAECMLSDEYKVWSEGPGKRAEAGFH